MISFSGITNAFHEALTLWRMVLPAMFVGCLCGNLLAVTRIWQQLESILRRSAERMRLPAAGGPYLAMCFLNRYAANAMIAGLQARGEFPQRYLTPVFLAGWFPHVFYFYVFYMIPALVGAVGVSTTGVFSIFYLTFNLVVALVGIALAIHCSRQDSRDHAPQRSPAPERVACQKPRATVLLRQSVAQFGRIALVFVPTTLFFALLLNIGHTTIWLEQLNPAFAHLDLPSASVLVILAGLPSTISGIAALGAVSQSSLLSPREVVVTLLIASCFHGIYEFFAGFLPANVAIFGSGRGWRLSITTLGVRLAATLAVLLAAVVIL